MIEVEKQMDEDAKQLKKVKPIKTEELPEKYTKDVKEEEKLP